MKKITKKFLSFLLVCVMLLGVLPMNVFAAGQTKFESRTLKLNEEQTFLLENEDHQVQFTYNAETAGTYIFYFRDLTSNPINIGWTLPNIEYYHDPDNGHFEGRVVEMNAGESYSVTFAVSEGYNPYGAIVGMKTLPTEFTGFYSKSGFDEENRIIDVNVGQGNLRAQFFTDDRFCYGVEWSTVSKDTSIVDINEDATEFSGVEYLPLLDLKNVGETEITFKGVYAGKTVEKTYTIRVHEGGSPQPGPSFQREFNDVDELITLINQNGGGEFFYSGQGALTFDKNVDFPGGSRLEANGNKIIIDSNVMVQVDHLNCKELEVRGQLIANEGIGVEKNLTVSGELYLQNNFLDMEYPATVNGLDHVNFREEYQKIVMNVRFDSASKLADLVDHVAANGYKDQKVEHIYRFQKENTDTRNVDLVIDKDITIAESDRLELFDFRSASVAKGNTLTINGDVGINAPVTINGCLVNNGMVDVSYRDNGKLILTDDESYAGNGELIVHCYNQADFDKCFVPKTRDHFDFTYDVDMGDGCYHYHVRHVAGLIKLGTPYNLRWDSQNAGFMSWNTKRPDQAQAEVKIYRKGETQPCYQGSFGFGEDEIPAVRTIDLFATSDLGSGTYYFTVQSIGDYKTYKNSDIAVSGYYTYSQPNKKLTACSKLKWFDKNDMYASWITWTGPTPSRYVDGYEIQFFYSETKNGTYELFGGMGGRSGNPSFLEEPFYDHFVQDRGEGYYKFKVRAISKDITQYRNGQWSELSPAFDLKKVPQNVTNDLDNLLNQNLPAQDVIDQVQAMDTADLKKTLLTDQENQGATEVLKQLENQVGGAANVVVTKDAAVFDGNQVSIVGANLNNKDEKSTPITLEIDKPEKQHVISELYKSSVAVRFSMTLDNVEDPKNLEVPVKISLPVPENINPGFLVILHYHVDGTHEIIRPYIYEMDGKIYADFVLTSFSDFVMTERMIPVDVGMEDVSVLFQDIESNAWYVDEIQYVYDKGIMNGVSDTMFEPETAVTRATIVQTLYKLEGKPEVTEFEKYDSLNDTLDIIWWKNGLAWALNEGVAKGDSNKNVFNPDNEVTREDLATFIYRYAQYKGINVELERTADEILEGTFVNSWAKDAFAWAIETGLIKGKTIDGVPDLAPQAGATRAELATIMMRFYENNDL